MNFISSTIATAVSEFWDVLTGITDDHRSKMIRIVILGVLSLGIIWAVLNYFRADKIADTQRESGLVSDYGSYRPRTGDETALSQIANVAQTLSELRDGGEAIATRITNIHKKPFNTEGYNEFGLEGLTMVNQSSDIAQQAAQAPEEPQAPQLNFKAIMNFNNKRVALVDAGGRSGLIVKQGDRLPNDLGRIVKIKHNKVTVRFAGRNFEYNVEGGTVTTKIRGVY